MFFHFLTSLLTCLTTTIVRYLNYGGTINYGTMNIRVPRNIRFECQRCARCCGDTSHRGRNIYLLDNEVENISIRTGLRPLSFVAPASNSGKYRFKMKKRSGKCVFLEGKACRIYDNRPLVCRFYPFSMKKAGNAFVFEVAKDCPGIGLGETLELNEFERMTDDARSKLNELKKPIPALS